MRKIRNSCAFCCLPGYSDLWINDRMYNGMIMNKEQKTFFFMNKSRDAAVKKNRYKRSRDK